ncbi:glycosyltransferase family 117 protein [Salisaeta longa]|uniref:glycosyltransferase family 117 protein n=1 Tax=Salisaeta longa TaxID=503170 RepID=UPI0003B4B22D|nr:DUF2723 domain-containing protein [Salisaeta longa]
MNWKTTDRIVAACVTLWALVLYGLTVAPTVSFWDAGEFIASVYKLQVMHPPGAPFYMLVGRLFAMLAPSKETVALAVNLISVLSSVGTVALTHLIIVRLVRRWQGEPSDWSAGDLFTARTAGVVGALTYAATDSFWFNAVEAEVYAFSMFFTALVVWLTLRWSEAARAEERMLSGGAQVSSLDANRYLIVIAYLFGLAIGVHLLNLLTFFFVALIVFFTEFDQSSWSTAQRWKGIVLTGVLSAGLFFLVYPGIILGLPGLLGSTGAPFLTIAVIAAVVGYGVYYTHKQKMALGNLAFMALTVILIGYSSYALIFIRSQTEPNIDLNDPDTAARFVSYLEREQYGSTPLLQGTTFDDATGQVPAQGNETWFPRRYSPQPMHWRVYQRYDSDLEFFLKYQIGHMYVRYFLWNFAGRASDKKDAPAMTGLSFIDPASLTDDYLGTPSEKSSRNVYFALPLLLGLFGAFYHFNEDWRRAFAVFILFFVTGIGIIIYLNQTPMQPRERDYSYVASFFAFSLWVGIGAAGLLQMAREALAQQAATLRRIGLWGVAALVLFAVPGWMTYQNYDDHDRSGNYVAHDYAYNMLQSLEEDAILFTNGDNDTYPLWYLQEVEGVRTDVRVVNLSLLNTSWYVKQLKNEPLYASEPLPISMTNQQIEQLRPQAFQPRTMRLPVPGGSFAKATLRAYTSDSMRVQRPMQWTLKGRPLDQQYNMLRAADVAAYNILRTNAANGWKRPIYFAVTVSPSGQLDLQNYFHLEGQAYRVMPIKHSQRLGRVVPGVTEQAMEGFRFTNLRDSTVYFNENARRLLDGYRLYVSQATERLAAKGYATRADSLLSDFVYEMPFGTVAASMQTYLLTARAFESVQNYQMMAQVMQQAEPVVFYELRNANDRRSFSYALQYASMVRLAYQSAGKQDALQRFDKRLNALLAEAPYRVPPEVRQAYGLSTGDSSMAAPFGGPPPAGGSGAAAPLPPAPQQ